MEPNIKNTSTSTTTPVTAASTPAPAAAPATAPVAPAPVATASMEEELCGSTNILDTELQVHFKVTLYLLGSVK